jgi:hypothetical protein
LPAAAISSLRVARAPGAIVSDQSGSGPPRASSISAPRLIGPKPPLWRTTKHSISLIPAPPSLKRSTRITGEPFSRTVANIAAWPTSGSAIRFR